MTDLLGGMGTALITTLYGVLLANFVFGPIAGKLETLSGIEVDIELLLWKVSCPFIQESIQSLLKKD